MMTTRKYQVRFVTPAFLGDFEQAGRWRTPPFKALLRQWWRVARAAQADFEVDTARLRDEEGRLFGVAADRTGRRSLVRIRLGSWERGQMTSWPSLAKVPHPEVEKARDGIDSGLYLGYGPITGPSGKKPPALKGNAAIQAGEQTTLALAFPQEHAELIDTALALIDRYATAGGRSRNGWGSFELAPLDGTAAFADPTAAVLRPWEEALALDWPHAIGADRDGALVWRTEPCEDWKALMGRLAELKIGLRTQFRFRGGGLHHQPEDRHWLGYPVTRHAVRGWGNQRLPNSLRFKARPTGDGRLVGVVFHVPCLPPRAFRPDRERVARVWQRVHRWLNDSGLERIAR